MTTTLEQIRSRALQWSSANGLTTLADNTAEIVNRIAADERALFDLALSVNAYYYTTTAAVTSTALASERTIVTSTLSPPVGRIIQLELPINTVINQVDFRDQDAELAPRFFLLGTEIREVGSDWGTSGAKTGLLVYVKRPTALVTTGALTQTITLDDQFADILEMKLAHYIAHKDVGRDEVELERLNEAIDARTADFVRALESFGGVESRRFNQPTKGGKK